MRSVLVVCVVVLPHVAPYGGFRLNLAYPASKRAGWSLTDKTRLVFWFKGINENVPAWQDANPIVTLYESDEKFLRLTPHGDLLSTPPYNEAREGWYYFAVPLAGDSQWRREGAAIDTVNWLAIGFDSWGAPPLRIWLDGLALEQLIRSTTSVTCRRRLPSATARWPVRGRWASAP